MRHVAQSFTRGTVELFGAHLACAAAGLFAMAAEAYAAAPLVEFDGVRIVAAEDITDASFARDFPSEKLIAARLELSSFVRRGDVSQIVQVTYRISAAEDLTVLDYSPRTTLAEMLAGNVAVQRQAESNTKLHAEGAARYFPFASGRGAFDAETAERTHLQFELAPPKELIAAAGTIERGRGVYFKLRPSRDASLEGARQFVVVWRAPAGWRGGMLRVEAESRSAVSGLLAGEEETAVCGRAAMALGIYLLGDARAKKSVAALLDAENQVQSIRLALAASSTKSVSKQVRQGFDEVAGLVDRGRREARRADEARHAELSASAHVAATARNNAAAALRRINQSHAPVRLPAVADTAQGAR